MLKCSDLNQEVIWCECCGKRPVAGNCIINGIRRFLSRTCRYCFMHHPEDAIQGTKRSRSGNYFIHNKAETK